MKWFLLLVICLLVLLGLAVVPRTRCEVLGGGRFHPEQNNICLHY